MTSAHPAYDLVRRLIAFDTTSRNSNLELIVHAAELLEIGRAHV